MELTGVVAPKDEDDYDRRPQRRRYEEPLSSKIRKQFLALAESPLKRVEDEIHFLAKTIVDNWEEAEVKEGFFEVVECMVREQSFKVPFVAAVVLCINGMKGEVVKEVVERMGSRLNDGIERGEWRDVKLCLKFLGGLQGVLEGEGVWIVLQDLLTKAVDLQTENNEEVSFPCAACEICGERC
jgi:nuclear cap-binding protein subunit 1